MPQGLAIGEKKLIPPLERPLPMHHDLDRDSCRLSRFNVSNLLGLPTGAKSVVSPPALLIEQPYPAAGPVHNRERMGRSYVFREPDVGEVFSFNQNVFRRPKPRPARQSDRQRAKRHSTSQREAGNEFGD